ncbi:uncharacterized protein LOC129590963 isoform X1 [Paramacrobiotus metropolitanus]|uniref:uncharacterized protein LOC129590963 isoform X1 n=1 Tax=Paramacrobiotus metropolitanus TaxID=2943436 RepID=UPI002446179B|nr:uncharacterized protein LOC129590963 isoform X1 [Paramacrobiotus metropolitanus]
MEFVWCIFLSLFFLSISGVALVDGQFSYAVNETNALPGPHVIPDWTIFNCSTRPAGLYADRLRGGHEQTTRLTGLQRLVGTTGPFLFTVFYLCTSSGLKFSMVCPGDTVFDEKKLDCVREKPGKSEPGLTKKFLVTTAAPVLTSSSRKCIHPKVVLTSADRKRPGDKRTTNAHSTPHAVHNRTMPTTTHAAQIA